MVMLGPFTHLFLTCLFDLIPMSSTSINIKRETSIGFRISLFPFTMYLSQAHNSSTDFTAGYNLVNSTRGDSIDSYGDTYIVGPGPWHFARLSHGARPCIFGGREIQKQISFIKGFIPAWTLGRTLNKGCSLAIHGLFRDTFKLLSHIWRSEIVTQVLRQSIITGYLKL